MAQQTDHIGDANKMVTAVEWLKEKLMYLDFHPNTLLDVLRFFEQAKQMEKTQIIEARDNGIKATVKGYSISNEDYYTELYKNQ